MKFNTLDKEILKIVLEPCGGRVICSKEIAERLSVPATTVQRRRRKLEDEGILTTYSCLDLKKFGWRHVDFLISTQNGKTMAIIKKLAKMREVVSITRSIGQPTIDLKVETILVDNEEILDMLEAIKSMDGVRDAIWSESIQRVVQKAAVPKHLIDSI
ncbi:MAG TPA: winged helix-turn-helix transcriptional regulator [Nitrososphaera sp.]|nr:winged helix-turn-helix transcriptional regulator [Nitrososphaera sp.]